MYILTGGAGFIGSNTLATLNRMDCTDILVVDNIGASSKWENLVGKSFRLYVHKNSLWPWLEKHTHENVEAVIHLGACTDTMEKISTTLLKTTWRIPGGCGGSAPTDRFHLYTPAVPLPTVTAEMGFQTRTTKPPLTSRSIPTGIQSIFLTCGR